MPKIPLECPWEGGGLHIRTWRVAQKSSAQLRFSRNCAPLILYSQIFHNSKEIIAFTSFSPLRRPKQSFTAHRHHLVIRYMSFFTLSYA